MSDEKHPEELLAEAKAWWTTEIIDIHPGKIAVRGYAIQDLIGTISFPQMIWLMLRGELPSAGAGEDCWRPRWSLRSITARTRPPSPSPASPPAPASTSTMSWRRRSMCWAMCMAAPASNAWSFTRRSPPIRKAEAIWPARWTRRWRHLSPPMARSFPASAIASIRSIRAARRCSRWSRRRARRGAVTGRYAEIGRAVEAGISAAPASPSHEYRRRHGRDFLRTGICRRRWAAGCSSCRARSAFSSHAWEEIAAARRMKGPMPKSIPYTYAGPGPRKPE